MSEVAGTAQAVLSVKDAQELLALQASLFQPLAEKTAAYSRHLYDIAQGTGAEFGKAFEAKAAEAQQSFAGLSIQNIMGIQVAVHDALGVQVRGRGGDT